MNKKISVLVMMLMMCLSAVLVIPNGYDVEAAGGGGGGEGEEGNVTSLDYDYIWDVTWDFANVVHDINIYPAGENTIRKGRAFGSDGDRWTADYINTTLSDDLGLENVTKLKLDQVYTPWLPIGKLKGLPWNCNYLIQTTDFDITSNHPDWTFTDDGRIPNNETFAMASGAKNRRPWDDEYGKLTYTNEFTNVRLLKKDITSNIVTEGASTNDYLNVPYTEVGVTEGLIGNTTYVTDSLPEDQEGFVFLINETEENQGLIDNVTNASGVILIYDDISDESHQANTTNCTAIVARVYKSNSNLKAVIEKLENGTSILATNNINTETISFIHNLSYLSSWWPSYDFFIINRTPGWEILGNASNEIYKANMLLPYFPHYRGYCHGLIIYTKQNDTHIMEATHRKWRGWKYDDPFGSYMLWSPHLQIFSINRTAGELLENDTNDPANWVSGNFSQKASWVDAYNVEGNITIDNSPGDAIVVISNRYDAWWGECPGDSGVGGGIVMGIAKYMTDYNITPKYNLSFLFTTGEEYLMRGAWHYSITHPGEDFNITRWIGTDQLGYIASSRIGQQTILSDNSTDGDGGIIDAIVNITNYVEDSGYGYVRKEASSAPGTDEAAFSRRGELYGDEEKYDCDTICIHKANIFRNWNLRGWFYHHNAGLNYTEGDSMNYIDRDDVNATFNYTWAIVKYYTVNPDSWFNTNSYSLGDSDDYDNLNDTFTFNFDVSSILPHDQVMINYSLARASETKATIYKTMNFSVNRSATTKEVSITLPADKSPGFYNFIIEIYNSTGTVNEIIDPLGNNNNQSEINSLFFLYPYEYNLTTPNITNVSDSPDPVGFGYNVTISADVTSEVNSTIDTVTVNVTYPDDSLQSFTMSNTVGDTYEYVFNDTWQHGEYEYGIWAIDVNGNESGSPIDSFNVSAQATISVCTVKDSYGDDEWVNVTDPPVAQIGYELLDNGEVLRIWNRMDSYYFNTSSGIQITNHYEEYWSHNVLMLGYYNNDVWNLIYRTDELSGFNKDIEFDGVSYVNATLWKDLTYAGYDFRLAIRYQLGVDDNELTVIPYIKNLGDEDIPYDLGFAWELKDIQVDMTPSGDYIEINGESYYLNPEDLDETYTNLAAPCFYIREDITGSTSESLYLRWDENLNYMVSVKSRTGQYNAPVTLGIKIGTLSVGQEKYTKLYWHDASEATFYFDAYLAGVEEWMTNPGYMVDGNTSNYASTPINSDVELCINNTCNGSDLGTISKVEIRAFGYYLGMYQRDIILRPVFYGFDGDNHVFVTTPSAGWSQWFDITDDTNAPDWDWIRVRDIDCDVESGYSPPGTTLYCSKVEIRVTYNVNYPPGITYQHPLNGATVGIAPVLSIGVYDTEGDNMNITWLSNSSGSWQVFGTNSSVGNGSYHQTMSNASVNGQWWYWKVNVTDGSNYVESSVHKFYTGYESKIVNTGSTDFKGYLLMQVQYYNSSNSTWVVADDTVNETSSRTMYWENPGGGAGQHIFALDSVFNGLVNTSNFSGFGNGTYRVYAALRDPDGNILVCDDETELIATYEFTIAFD